MKIKFLHFGLLGVALLLTPNAHAQAIIQIASDSSTSFFVKSDGSLWKRVYANVIHITNGSSASFIIRSDGNVLSGDYARALAKHQEKEQRFESELIVSNGVTAVAVNGQRDTFFIKKDGSLWAMGNNDGGFLGDGTCVTPDHPIQLVPSGVTAVACGEAFTLFLKDDGSVWGFGWNGDGPLGDGTQSTFITRPKQIISEGVVAIAAGYSHSLFIKSDGSLWGTGNNKNGYGQLGLGTNVSRVLRPVQIQPSNVVSVAAGAYHSLFIKSDGSLWAMGANQMGQLGDCGITRYVSYYPEQIVPHDVVAITAGYEGSLFLKKDGSLWGMGVNWWSDYGEGIAFRSRCPTQVFASNDSALVAGYYYNAQFKTCASLWAGQFNNNPGAIGTAAGKAGFGSSVANLPGANLITIESLADGNVRLTYSGNAGVHYALERCNNLADPKWVPLVTNTAPSGGTLVITNTPDTSANNFWRIRSVP